MYAGEVVEYGSVAQVFKTPLHPYTVGLFNAIPVIGKKSNRLNTIPGTVPGISGKPDECTFYPRCDRREKNCLEKAVPLLDIGDSHLVRCIRL